MELIILAIRVVKIGKFVRTFENAAGASEIGVIMPH